MAQGFTLCIPHCTDVNMFCLGEGWNNFREAKKDLWVDPQPVRRGNGRRENSLDGQAHFMVLICACVTLSGTRFVGLISLRVSSTVTPSKVCTPFQLERIRLPESQRHQKEWRDPLNRKNGEAHIQECHQSIGIVSPQNQTRQPREHGD